MWKMKYPVFKKLLDKNLTHSEVVFLLYLCMHQDEEGWAYGVYFKDVQDETGLSVQSYYNAWKGLVEKEIIYSEKTHPKDRDFKILENELKGKESFRAGYYNLSEKIFSDPEFANMKANEILIAMDMLKNNMSGKRAFVIGAETFFEKYKKLFGVNERTVRNYMQTIRKFFHIKYKNAKYSILPRFQKVYKQGIEELGTLTEEQSYRNDVVRRGCNRARIEYYNEQEFSDTAHLLVQYKEYGTKARLSECLIRAIEKSILRINENIKEKSKWRYILNCKLVHTIFHAELGLG